MIVRPRYLERAISEAAEASGPENAYRQKLSDKFRHATVGMTRAEQLHYALRRDKMADAQVLLETGAVPEDKTLLLAVEKRKAEWVKLFMDHGVKPTQMALDYSRYYGSTKERDILLGAGIIPSEGTLAYAVSGKNKNWVKAYIAHGAKPTPDMVDDAARLNWDIEMAKVLLAAGVVPGAKTLEFVVGYKRDNLIKRFLNEEWKPKTPKSEWIKALAAAGAEPTSDMLRTAMHNKDMETARALVEHGAVVDYHAASYARGVLGENWTRMLKSAHIEFCKTAAKKSASRSGLVLRKPATSSAKIVLRRD